MKQTMLAFVITISFAFSQSKDSTIIFTSPEPEGVRAGASSYDHAWGVDILLSNNGFGLGSFYRHQYTRDLYGTVTFGIAESKDDNEVEYYDYWGQSFSPGKINRFLLMPLFFGVQYRLFADDITDSFRPYVNAGAGPTMILVHPYRDEVTLEQMDYFKSLGLARPHWTAGGYVGFGAFFGADLGSLSGINIRYYFIPVSGGIPSLITRTGQLARKADFGGFFITINLGAAF